MVSHTMKPEVGLVCRGRMPPEDNTHHVYAIRVRPSFAYRQNLLSSLKTTEHLSTLQSTLSRHHNSRTWRSRGSSGSQARGTRDMSPVTSRRLPMVLGDTAGATCTRISTLNDVRAATPARTMRLHYAAVQNLVYGCGNVSQTAVESSETLPILIDQTFCGIGLKHGTLQSFRRKTTV